MEPIILKNKIEDSGEVRALASRIVSDHIPNILREVQGEPDPKYKYYM